MSRVGDSQLTPTTKLRDEQQLIVIYVTNNESKSTVGSQIDAERKTRK